MSGDSVHKISDTILNKLRVYSRARVIAITLVTLGVLILLYLFLPLLIAKIDYLTSTDENRVVEERVDTVWSENRGSAVPNITPIEDLFPDKEFSIIIPKIDARSRVIADVDPFDQVAYTVALNNGIAHAKGTAYPDQIGNTFLFAHSALNFYDLVKQNVNFFLLTELVKGDEIYIMYKGEMSKYIVEKNIKVDPEEIGYLTTGSDHGKLTLMTCWPAGTDFKRVIVEATKQ